MEAILLMRNIVVLAEDAAQIAAGKEDRATTIMALETWLLAEVWRDCIDDYICANEAGPAFLEAIDAAEPRAEVAIR